MDLTNKLRRRFIKDYSLPIALTDEPYFSYFVNMYDESFDVKKKLLTFMEIVNKFESEEEVLNYLQSITDGIINDIKTKPEYLEFLKTDMNKYSVKNKKHYPSSSIFKSCHTGKELISIDLSKANFQAMNYFNTKILDAETYREFLLKYTNYEYTLNSKYIRQIIFGNLNNGRLDTIEKYMIYQIVTELEPKGFEILLVTTDEIVLEGNSDVYKQCIEITNSLPFNVAVEHFVLKQLKNEDNHQPFKSDKFFVKEFIAYTDDKKLPFEIKATDATFYPQFFKLITKQPINENDLVFINEGFVASYKNPISGIIE